MARGAKDDSNILSTGLLNIVPDLGELAVRLGSPVSWVRSGQVLLLDTFTDGASKCLKTTTGNRGSWEYETDYSLFDGVCLKLLTGATDEDGAWLTYHLPVVQENKVGCMFHFYPDAVVETVELLLNIYCGDNNFITGIRYNQGDATLEYLDSFAAWQVFAYPVGRFGVGLPVNVLKLIVDPETGLYHKAIYQGTEYDLSALSLRSVENGGRYEIEVHLAVFNISAAEATMLVDGVVVTQNES